MYEWNVECTLLLLLLVLLQASATEDCSAEGLSILRLQSPKNRTLVWLVESQHDLYTFQAAMRLCASTPTNDDFDRPQACPPLPLSGPQQLPVYWAKYHGPVILMAWKDGSASNNACTSATAISQCLARLQTGSVSLGSHPTSSSTFTNSVPFTARLMLGHPIPPCNPLKVPLQLSGLLISNPAWTLAPIYFASTALETGNNETAYKLDKANWGVCSHYVTSTALVLYDTALWFRPLSPSQPGDCELALTHVADFDYCDEYSWVAKAVRRRAQRPQPQRRPSLNDPPVPAIESQRFGTCRAWFNTSEPMTAWTETGQPKIDNRQLAAYHTEQLLLSNSSVHVTMTTHTEPTKCNFYIGLFETEHELWWPTSHQSKALPQLVDDSTTSDLTSSLGYVLGTKLEVSHATGHPGLSWLAYHPRPYDAYGGLGSEPEEQWFLQRALSTISAMTQRER